MSCSPHVLMATLCRMFSANDGGSPIPQSASEPEGGAPPWDQRVCVRSSEGVLLSLTPCSAFIASRCKRNMLCSLTLLPPCAGTQALRDWDLWGPLIFTIVLVRMRFGLRSSV